MKLNMLQFYFFILLFNGVLSRFLDDASNSELNAVRIRLTEEKSQRLLLRNDVETLMMKTEALERKINAQLPDSAVETLPSSGVYFNVRLGSHMTIDEKHIIVFDKVLENAGSGYSLSTGIFRVPTTGVYLFSLSILSRAKGQYAHIQLMKNETEIGRVFSGSDVARWPQAGSVTIPAYLVEGDEVFAREFPSHTGHLHGDFFCSFSGIKMHA